MLFPRNRARKRWFFTILLLVCAASRSDSAAQLDSARVHEITSFLSPHPIGVGPAATNRMEWEKLASRPAFKKWLDDSRKKISEPFPKSSDELFLEFSRTGNRTHWQARESERRNRMSSLALAECLEHQGHFVRPLEEAIQEICAERTWVYPAHDRARENFKGTAITIDLGSSAVAWELATIHCLLGDKLSVSTRKLIQDNLQRRIFQPYRDMVEGRRKEDYWLRASHNWNAVCLANVTGAALAILDSQEERAWFIASAQSYIRNFLNGFSADGYCSEGLSYWNYGFGHFVTLGETVRQATSGRVDFLADPAALAPALFGRRIEILDGIYPSIADCHPGTRPDLALATFLCRRLNLTPCLSDNDVFIGRGNSLRSTALFSFLPDKLPQIFNKLSERESLLRIWFPDGGVLICRPAANAKIPFAVSLKGGNNAEHHNHNDIGSYIVVAGGSMVVADPGAEVYTARTFGARRYESDVLNSFGHDVPVVAGQLQRTGVKALGRVLRTDFSDAQDTLSLDIKSAYAVPGLTRLERTFLFRRGHSPFLSVRDDVEFVKPESFETALVTWGKWTAISDTEFLVTDDARAVRVTVDTGGLPFEIRNKQLEADVTTPKKATRIGIALKEPATNASIVLTITPQIGVDK